MQGAPQEKFSTPIRGSQDTTSTQVSVEEVQSAEAQTEQESPESKPATTQGRTVHFVKFNPFYMLQMRGLLNLLQIALTLVVIVVLAKNCTPSAQGYGNVPVPANTTAPSFSCSAPGTVLFITACSAFFGSVLFICSCVLSTHTSLLLFDTTFEIAYYLLYFLLLFIFSIFLMAYTFTVSQQFDQRVLVASIVGLVCSCIYGISAVWFFVSHRCYADPRLIILDESEILPGSELKTVHVN